MKRKTILFICEGNVGRSQMAEGFYNFYMDKNASLSAGVNDVGAKYNYMPREDIVLAMKEKGIDIAKQRIKQITPEILEEAKEVIVLCDPKLLPSFVKKGFILRQVPDSYESSMNGVRKIRDIIEEIVLDLIAYAN